MFKLINPTENEHVAQAAESRHAPVGHFIRVRKGAKVRLPVQVFTLLETPQGRQFHHNITVIEEGAEVEMISGRSEEHTSELQSLMRISYAVFCLKKKNKKTK